MSFLPFGLSPIEQAKWDAENKATREAPPPPPSNVIYPDVPQWKRDGLAE
jgi:hypothetical protein